MKVMKMWIILCGLCGLFWSASGVPVGGYPDSLQKLDYGSPYGGGDDQYEPANYDFQYEVYGGGNFFGHQESRRDQKTNGKYHVLLPDGRRQIVTYIADETGYHPTITYEVVGAPLDNPSGGYGGGNTNSGGYGGRNTPSSGYGGNVPSGGYGNNAPSGGYESKGPSGAYGSPLSDNGLGSGSLNRYSSRIKRQFYAPDDFSDFVKIYKSEKNPEQRYRNRRRRHSAPKKGYLIIYPDSFSRQTTGEGEVERIVVPPF